MINESKTIETLEKYYEILKSEPKSKDDKFFACNIEFDLAKSLRQEFGEEVCHKLAKMLLADEKQNRTKCRHRMLMDIRDITILHICQLHGMKVHRLYACLLKPNANMQTNLRGIIN